MVRYLVYMVFMSILVAIIENMNRKRTKNVSGETDFPYMVAMPPELKYVYLGLFGMGALLFFVFLFFGLKGNPSITAGNYIFSLMVCTIGLLVSIYASRWHIIVGKDGFDVYRLFRRPVYCPFKDIDKAIVSGKSEIELYRSGKRFLTVSPLCTNSERFYQSLMDHGKFAKK